MFLLWRTSPVGSDCRASLHAKTLSLEGTRSFQIEDHPWEFTVLFDIPCCSSNHSSLWILVFIIRLYAERTEKRPCWSSTQAQKSTIILVHKGIFSIHSASNGVCAQALLSISQRSINELGHKFGRVCTDRGERLHQSVSGDPIVAPYVCGLSIANPPYNSSL